MKKVSHWCIFPNCLLCIYIYINNQTKHFVFLKRWIVFIYLWTTHNKLTNTKKWNETISHPIDNGSLGKLQVPNSHFYIGAVSRYNSLRKACKCARCANYSMYMYGFYGHLRNKDTAHIHYWYIYIYYGYVNIWMKFHICHSHSNISLS